MGYYTTPSLSKLHHCDDTKSQWHPLLWLLQSKAILFWHQSKKWVDKKRESVSGFAVFKVQKFWGGYKNLKKISQFIWHYILVMSKKLGFFQNCVAFSQYLNFTSKWGVRILEVVLKFLKPYCFICEFRIIQYLTEKNEIIIAFEIIGLLT